MFHLSVRWLHINAHVHYSLNEVFLFGSVVVVGVVFTEAGCRDLQNEYISSHCEALHSTPESGLLCLCVLCFKHSIYTCHAFRHFYTLLSPFYCVFGIFIAYDNLLKCYIFVTHNFLLRWVISFVPVNLSCLDKLVPISFESVIFCLLFCTQNQAAPVSSYCCY